jgi:hypothetical protein
VQDGEIVDFLRVRIVERDPLGAVGEGRCGRRSSLVRLAGLTLSIECSN